MSDDGSIVRGKRLAAQLQSRGVRGILVLMAERGQLVKLRCEMPVCYCPDGRSQFEHASQPMPEWAPNMDHYPWLKEDGGEREPANARLAHVYCNSQDHSWRLRIRRMLREERSLQEIADTLNRKGVRPPPRNTRWTADSVRWAYVS